MLFYCISHMGYQNSDRYFVYCMWTHGTGVNLWGDIISNLIILHQLLIKSYEVSISVLEICKLDLISDIIYFIPINANIIYLA